MLDFALVPLEFAVAHHVLACELRARLLRVLEEIEEVRAEPEVEGVLLAEVDVLAELVRGQVAQDQVNVEPEQDRHENGDQRREAHDGHYVDVDHHLAQVVADADVDNVERVRERDEEEQHKGPAVFLADAVPEPVAVVVVQLDARPARVAVVDPERLVDVTLSAELHEPRLSLELDQLLRVYISISVRKEKMN